MYTPPEDDRPRREALLERLHGRYPSTEDISTNFQVIEGDPSEEILRMAEDVNVNLIVIGTHGRTGLEAPPDGQRGRGGLAWPPLPVLSVRSPTAMDPAAEESKGRRQAEPAVVSES